VNFNINEQEVLNIRADMRRLGMTAEELKQYPIEVGLQTDKGYPYRGTLNYVSPSIDRATGTLAVRAILGNSDQVLVPGNFVRVRVGAADEQESLLAPDAALGRAAQGYDRSPGRRPACDRERAQARRSHRRRRHPAGDPGSEGRSAARDPRCDAGLCRGRQIAAAP
jgi:hypothetical protein